MRFGKDFKAIQDPLWSSTYIRYEQLKTLLKLTCGGAGISNGSTNANVILESLWDQCISVEKPYLIEYRRLYRLCKQVETVMNWRDDLKVKQETLDTINAIRRQLVTSSLLYVDEHLRRLLLFAKANADAASRILEKLIRVNSSSREDKDAFKARFAFFEPKQGRELADFIRIQLRGVVIEKVAVSHWIWYDFSEDILKPFYEIENESHTKQQLHRLMEITGLYMTMQQAEEATDDNSLLRCLTDSVLSCIKKIEELPTNSRAECFNRDDAGRTPLHYAAEHGMDKVIRKLLVTSTFKRFGMPMWLEEMSQGVEVANLSPLALCLRKNQRSTFNVLLSALIKAWLQRGGTESTVISTALARSLLECGDLDLLREILKLRFNINATDNTGDRLLCIAASKRMHEACILLLQSGADVNAKDLPTGRTALTYACMAGDMELFEMLLAKGADPSLCDARGWLPIEHAAYRGHFALAKVLDQHEGSEQAALQMKDDVLMSKPLASLDKTSRSHVPWVRSDARNQACIWISLGNIDALKPRNAVQINEFTNRSQASGQQQEVLYSISVSTDKDGEFYYEAELPLLGSSINAPWLFCTDDIADTKLVWKLYTYRSGAKDNKELVGSGIALLGILNSGLGPKRESVVRDATIPLQDPKSFTFAGTVTFTYFWSTPREQPKSLGRPQSWHFGNGVGGHRGSGKNKLDDRKLQIGENTPQSFLTAVGHGASFIEFDVQLTKDLIPVIYHDFLLSETGTDSPLHHVSFEQFEYLSRAQGPRRKNGVRSNSLHAADHGYLEEISERMARTHFNKVQGYKANTRGNFIHEKSCTLEDLFKSIPESTGMNIELKYPMLFETDDWDMERLAIKTDIYVDTILDKVYQHAKGRRIVFSSFSPEICIALSTKQRTYPVFFLSKTAAPKGEVRSCCIQQAIHFAKSWGLRGIVVECTPLIKCPRLIRYVTSAGLACMSFGALNSQPELAQIQFDAGIDAVISDSVRAITLLSNKPQPEDGSSDGRVSPISPGSPEDTVSASVTEENSSNESRHISMSIIQGNV